MCIEETRGRAGLVVDRTMCLSPRARGRAREPPLIAAARAPAEGVAPFVCSVWEICGKGELAVHPSGVIGVAGIESSATGKHKTSIGEGPLSFPGQQ